jgi:EpsI family protein
MRAVVASTLRIPLLIAGLMLAASIGAVLARPAAKVAQERLQVPLAAMIPLQFGEWREEPLAYTPVVDPQTRNLLDKLYADVLSRTYVDRDGYHIMLSLAYGSDQRGELQAHKPEVCYPAQGFTLSKNDPGQMTTRYGDIPVRRLFGTRGTRQEPVTYWFSVGDEAVRSQTQKRLVDLRYGLTGRIPDGMLFRVSSIDGDASRAYGVQQRFVSQLLDALAPEARKRISGLGGTETGGADGK